MEGASTALTPSGEARVAILLFQRQPQGDRFGAQAEVEAKTAVPISRADPFVTDAAAYKMRRDSAAGQNPAGPDAVEPGDGWSLWVADSRGFAFARRIFQP